MDHFNNREYQTLASDLIGDNFTPQHLTEVKSLH